MEIDIATTEVYAEFDVGTLVYLAFILVGFIVNQISKSKKKQQEQQQRQRGAEALEDEARPSSPPNRGKTFEELLEEFTNSSPEPVEEERPTRVREEKRPAPQPVSKPVHNPYQEFMKERQTRVKDESHRSMKTPFKKFDEFEEEEAAENDYAELLSSPDSARKAFVLSEIFQRKY